MKKLKLKAIRLGADELLSREQLKNVVGGSGWFSGIGRYSCHCNNGGMSWSDDYWTEAEMWAAVNINCPNGIGARCYR